MKKSELFTIIIASILAFLVIWGIYVKKHNFNVKPTRNQEISTESSSLDILKEEMLPTTEQGEPETKVLTKDTHKNSYTKENQIKKSEPKKISLQQIETKPTEDEILDKPSALESGIIHDKETGDIIITKEFKMKSPAKYSFK